ncbi:DMT family transporter [Cobetia sp. L2A1]|uniref:DMT family transporter n=1 Tax=Cobetia sp. L2A1 TaxID=2686360 RepID=UPI00131A735B|nr:multidrug efflux SMR transporter [Cobetia sp. L2A1]
MDWVFLIASGFCEVIGVAGFNQYAKNSRRLGVALVAIGFSSSLSLLYLAMDSISLGIAYAVFSGIGTVVSAVIGVMFWKEYFSLRRMACIGVIVLSIVGLHLTSGH